MASPKYVRNVTIHTSAYSEQTMNPNSQVRRYMSRQMKEAKAAASAMTLAETKRPSNQTVRMHQAYTHRFITAGDQHATYVLSNTKNYAIYVIQGVAGYIKPKAGRYLQVGKSQLSRRRGKTLTGPELSGTNRREGVRGQRKKDYLRRAVKKVFRGGASI